MPYEELFGPGGAPTPRDDASRGDARPAPPPASAPAGIHPWMRFFARNLDWTIAFVLVGLIALLLPPRFGLWWERRGMLLFSFLIPVLWALPEGWLLSRFGTTPGKAAFGLRVTDAAGGRLLPFGTATRRALRTWARGIGFGIPLVNVIAMVLSYGRLRGRGRTAWDESLGTRVGLRGPVGVRVLAGAAAWIFVFVIGGWVNLGAWRVGSFEAVTARSEAVALRDWLSELTTGAGGRMVPRSRMRSGRLASGETADFRVRLGAGIYAATLAACDLDCFDVDVRVTGPGGEVVGFDELDDPEPLAFFDVAEEGEYVVRVTMRDCRGEACGWAAQTVETTVPVELEGSGTCFAVSADGLLVTAAHLVHGARTIRVTFPGEPVLDAGIVRISERDDVALLRAGASVPQWLTFADPESVRPGDRVFTVGYPVADFLGEEPKYTDGAVSSLTGAEGDARRMQVSVPIQPGNSGGPLLNEAGRVVGIVVATASSQEFEWATGVAPQNVNWAVKAGPASRMVEEELGELPAAPPATDRGTAVARARASVCFVETGPPLEDGEEMGPAVDTTALLEAPARNRVAAGPVRRREGGRAGQGEPRSAATNSGRRPDWTF